MDQMIYVEGHHRHRQNHDDLQNDHVEEKKSEKKNLSESFVYTYFYYTYC